MLYTIYLLDLLKEKQYEILFKSLTILFYYLKIVIFLNVLSDEAGK